MAQVHTEKFLTNILKDVFWESFKASVIYDEQAIITNTTFDVTDFVVAHKKYVKVYIELDDADKVSFDAPADSLDKVVRLVRQLIEDSTTDDPLDIPEDNYDVFTEEDLEPIDEEEDEE